MPNNPDYDILKKYIDDPDINSYRFYHDRLLSHSKYNEKEFLKLFKEIYKSDPQNSHFHNLCCLLGIIILEKPLDQFQIIDFYEHDSQLSLLNICLANIKKQKPVKYKKQLLNQYKKKTYTIPHFKRVIINLESDHTITINDKTLLRKLEEILLNNLPEANTPKKSRGKRDEEFTKAFWCSTKIIFRYLKDTIPGLTNAEGYLFVGELCKLIGKNFEDENIESSIKDYLKKTYSTSNCP